MCFSNLCFKIVFWFFYEKLTFESCTIYWYANYKICYCNDRLTDKQIIRSVIITRQRWHWITELVEMTNALITLKDLTTDPFCSPYQTLWKFLFLFCFTGMGIILLSFYILSDHTIIFMFYIMCQVTQVLHTDRYIIPSIIFTWIFITVFIVFPLVKEVHKNVGFYPICFAFPLCHHCQSLPPLSISAIIVNLHDTFCLNFGIPAMSISPSTYFNLKYTKRENCILLHLFEIRHYVIEPKWYIYILDIYKCLYCIRNQCQMKIYSLLWDRWFNLDKPGFQVFVLPFWLQYYRINPTVRWLLDWLLHAKIENSIVCNS